MIQQQIKTKSSRNIAAYILVMWLTSVFIKEYSDSDFLILIPWALLTIPLFIYKRRVKLAFSKVQIQTFSLLLYLLVITFVNKIISTETRYDYFRLLSEVFFLLIVPTLIIAIYCNNFPNLKEHFLKQYSITMIICAGLGLIEYALKVQPYAWMIRSTGATENFIKYSDINSALYRASLFFYHPIYYGMYVTIALVIITVLPFKNKLVQIISYIILISGALLSKSRVCWFALLFVAILYGIKNISVVFSKKAIRNIIFWTLGLFLIGIVFSRTPIMNSMVNAMFDRVNNLSGSNIEYGARLANLSIPGKIATEKSWLFFILGGGMGYGKSFLMANPSINNWTEAIDNQFLTLFIDTGIIGLLIYIGMFVTVTLEFFKRKNKIEELMCLLLILSLVFSVACDIISVQSVFYLVMIFIGLSSELGK